MIKVCQVTSVHNRYDVRIFQKISKSLANNGYDVSLLCIDQKPDEIIDGIKIISVKKAFKNRVDRILSSGKLLLKQALEINADIYHLHDPELLSLGVKLKKNGKKVIFDSHEDYGFKIMEKPWLPRRFRPLVRKLYESKEKKSIKKFDAVVSVTPHICDRLKKINDNTVMITNYPTAIANITRNPERILCFAGGISPHYMHDKIIEAISEIDNIKYYIAGECADEYTNYLKTIPGFNKVVLLGKLSYDKVLELYSKSMVGLVVCNYSESLGGKLGTLGVLKLFEYIACSVPMVATDFQLWKPIVEDNEIGICVNPQSVTEIRSAIVALLDKNRNETFSRNCAKISDKFSWDSQEKILLDLYREI